MRIDRLYMILYPASNCTYGADHECRDSWPQRLHSEVDFGLLLTSAAAGHRYDGSDVNIYQTHSLLR